jgi:hypothetical protein
LCRAAQRKYDQGDKRKEVKRQYRTSAVRRNTNLLAARLYRHLKRMDRINDPRFNRKGGLKIFEMMTGMRFDRGLKTRCTDSGMMAKTPDGNWQHVY